MKRAFARVGLALASATLVLGAGELALRRALPLGGLLVAPDEDLLFRPVPHAATAHRMTDGGVDGGWVVARLNAEGLRGPELGPRDPGRARILVCGDSLVQALGTPLERTFPARLAHELADLGQKAEALNAGVSGYGPDQSLLYFESIVERLEPDLVVLVVCVQNDVRDVLRNKLLALDAHGALVPRSPTVPPELVERYRAARRAERGSALLRLARAAWAGPPERGTLRTPEELARLRPRGHRRFDADARALLGAILERFQDRAAEHGASFALVLVPSSFDLAPDFVPGLDPASVEPYDRRASTDAFAALAAERGIPCLDLFEPMRARGPGELFLPGEFHWTAAGQAFAARRSAERVVEAGWLGGAER